MKALLKLFANSVQFMIGVMYQMSDLLQVIIPGRLEVSLKTGEYHFGIVLNNLTISETLN